VHRIGVARRRQEGRDDQQDAVGAHRPRLDHLIRIDDEVLAQHRQAARRARLDQIIGRTLKVLAVGQHRQAGRATRLVGTRDVRRPEVGAQHALGRACLLHFRDHGRLATRNAITQCGDEIA
jgi:hypothetical protein